MLPWGYYLIRLLPRVPSGDDQDSIEADLVKGALGGMQMGNVDRVEGPAENSGSHGIEDRAGEVSPAEALG
jgi:hypothetical protein